MRILILGSGDFGKAFEALGHEVLTWESGLGGHPGQARLDPDWSELSRQLGPKAAGLDVVLVCDNLGRRTLPTGLWGCPALTVFYGIDAPLNRFWQEPYARLFDLVFFDQPAEAEEFSRLHRPAHWLPVGVDFELYQGKDRGPEKPGVCFVGVRDEKVRPKRSALLDKVAKLAPLTVLGGRQGEWLDVRRAARLYRSHQVMLNENLFCGLTTRPLEGMASGACVLSEAAPGAMDIYFNDNEDISYFDSDDLEERLKLCLGDGAYRLRLERNGREAVRAGHTMEHRVRAMLRHIGESSAKPSAGRLRKTGLDALRLEGEALLMTGARWPHSASSRLPRALGRLEAGVNSPNCDRSGLEALGLAASLKGDYAAAGNMFAQAAQGDNDINVLRHMIAAWLEGDAVAVSRVGGGLRSRYPELRLEPGRAEFHLACARVMIDLGGELTPGFNRQPLPMPFWQGLEHLMEAVRLDPTLYTAWELAGDVLLKRGAPNQAHDCYVRARSGGDRTGELRAKTREAARKGYLL